MKTIKVPVVPVVISLMLILSACRKPASEFTAIRSLAGNAWPRDSVLRFDYRPRQGGNKDFFVFVANTNHYPYANLYLIVRSTKKGKHFADTLEYDMTDGRGRWLGVKVGNDYENLLVFKWNVPVDTAETIRFELEPATRNNERLEGDSVLPGISRVGIVVKPHLTNNRQ